MNEFNKENIDNEVNEESMTESPSWSPSEIDEENKELTAEETEIKESPAPPPAYDPKPYYGSTRDYAYYTEQRRKKSKKRTAATLIALAVVLFISVVGIAGISVYNYLDGNILPRIQNNRGNDLKLNDPPSNSDGTTVLNWASKAAEKVSPSVVGILSSMGGYNSDAVGTGIIISADGFIVTNAHVVNGATEVKVVFSNKKEYKAQIIGEDTYADLAVIKIDAKGLTPAELGKSDLLKVGEFVIAMGNPLGLELANTVTFGVVSAINRDIEMENRTMTLIQTDASISPGNSGGPLVNMYGQVVGINSVKITQTSAEGLGFAIPIATAKPIIDELISYGYVKGRPMIGIQGEDVTESLSQLYKLPQGVYVRFVNQDSDAAKKGVLRGDIITKLNGQKVTDMKSLNKLKDKFKAGETITLTVYRNGNYLDIKITLSENKPQ